MDVDYQIGMLKDYKDCLEFADQYAIDSLLKEIEEIKNKDKDFWKYGLNIRQTTAIASIWDRNHRRLPFVFNFDPEMKMPKVTKDKWALMIWAAWRSSHLLGSHQDLNSASLTVAKYMRKNLKKEGQDNPEFTNAEKLVIIRLFDTLMHSQEDIKFWDENIFPLITGKRNFWWVKRLKEEKK